MADWNKIAGMIRNAKAAGATVTLQKNWIRIDNAHGVTMYVQQPGKNATTRKVHLSGTGHDGTVGGKEIPVEVKFDGLPSQRVGFEYDLDRDGGKFFAELLEAFPRLTPTYVAVRGGRASGPAPDVAKDLAI